MLFWQDISNPTEALWIKWQAAMHGKALLSSSSTFARSQGIYVRTEDRQECCKTWCCAAMSSQEGHEQHQKKIYIPKVCTSGIGWRSFWIAPFKLAPDTWAKTSLKKFVCRLIEFFLPSSHQKKIPAPPKAIFRGGGPASHQIMGSLLFVAWANHLHSSITNSAALQFPSNFCL